jgi:hypothetical protein
MKKSIFLLCMLPVFVIGCAYRTPAARDMEAYSRMASTYSEDDIERELQRAFVGREIFGPHWECKVVEVSYPGLELSCRRTTVKYSNLVLLPDEWIDLCPPEFEAVRQIPLMNYNFFINGVNLGGDKDYAMRIYHLLQKWCE